MSAPSGYTALDFVGFTDKGTYSPSATYMRNDLVHYGGNIMRCLIDNTTNVTPVVGANWELWVGASANLVERVIAPLENNPADVAYGVGRQIIYDDWLWEVIAPIAVGDALVDYAVDPTNANIKKSAPVETQLLAVKAEADATDNMIAPTEASASSSSAPYSVGDQLILNNILYDVIAAIQIGDVLTTGTGGNIAAADNLTDQLAAKANSSDLGTAAAKNSTNAVTSGSTALVESGAVYSEVDSVKQALTNQATNIAQKVSGSGDEYSSSKNYEIGNLCIHDNVLYRCTQNCSAASWAVNQNCFEPVTLANAINNTAFVKYISTGSFHDIVTPGIYYVANAVTDKPSGSGVYILGRQGIAGIAGIYISLYGSREVYSIRKIDDNWYTEQISIPNAITISGTTTASGALHIPEEYNTKPLISAYIIGTVGFALRRDAGYLTLFNNNLTPMANTELSVRAIFLNQSM